MVRARRRGPIIRAERSSRPLVRSRDGARGAWRERAGAGGVPRVAGGGGRLSRYTEKARATDGGAQRMKRLIYVAYFLEVGLLLVLVPWTAFWDRNYFVISSPFFQEILKNHFARGAVSGLGLVNLLFGFEELAALLYARRGL